MFIKFSDKTKKIMVKNSRRDIVDGYVDENCIYLDENNGDNRRLDALKSSAEDDSGKDKQ